jgi:uncharacterized protein YjbJ (UPF0337 family)
MNWDQLKGKWWQFKGSARQQWGKLTDDDLEYIAGHRESLIGKLQERYGLAKEEAQKKADEWVKAMSAKDEGMQSPPAHASKHDYQETGKR